MNKFIVTTTINPPTEAIRKFEEMEDWTLIVVGDIKTPEYNADCIYLGPEDQDNIDKELSELIGWNCIQRRSLGFIEAFKRGADIVATVDDDNIPYDNWGKEIFVGKEIEVKTYSSDLGIFDPVFFAGNPGIWHRGFPYQLVQERRKPHNVTHKSKTVKVDIQADFWNGDPDIDAICRMVNDNPKVEFDEDYWFPFSFNGLSPFNSQNTFLTRKALKYYFMMPHVGRMDDIWPSYYLESLGFKVVYNKPTVEQVRDNSNIIRDLKNEVYGYENTLDLVCDLRDNGPEKFFDYLPSRSKKAFKRYMKHFEE